MFTNSVSYASKLPWNVCGKWFHSTKTLYAPYDARHLREQYQYSLKSLTNGEFGIGHPIVDEWLPDGTYRVDGYFT